MVVEVTNTFWYTISSDFITTTFEMQLVFGRISILSIEQAVYRLITPYPGAFSTFACTMQDVVWSNRALADLCDSCPWDLRL